MRGGSAMRRKGVIASAVVFTGMMWIAPGLQAQACQGLPQGSRGGFAFSLGFPEEAKSYGISGLGSSEEGNLYFGTSFAITSYDLEGVENEKTAGGVIAYEIPSLTPGASLCPTVGAAYSWIEDLKTWSVPFGVGLGKTMNLEGGGAALTPHVTPQFLYVDVSLHDESESDWFFGLTAGATFSFTNFFIGGFVSKIFEEEADAVFGAQVGMAWR
jgi:hypothetical protein